MQSRPRRITQAIITTTAAARKPVAPEPSAAAVEGPHAVQWVPATQVIREAPNSPDDQAASGETASQRSTQEAERLPDNARGAEFERQGSSGGGSNSVSPAKGARQAQEAETLPEDARDAELEQQGSSGGGSSPVFPASMTHHPHEAESLPEDAEDPCVERLGSSGGGEGFAASALEAPSPHADPTAPSFPEEVVSGVSQAGTHGAYPQEKPQPGPPTTPAVEDANAPEGLASWGDEGSTFQSPVSEARNAPSPPREPLSSEQIQRRMGELLGVSGGKVGREAPEAVLVADLQRTSVGTASGDGSRGGESSGSKVSGQLYDILMESLDSPAGSMCQSRLVSN